MVAQQESGTVEVDRARQRLGELVEAVTRDRVRVRLARDGRPVAALVSARDLDWLERLERERAEQFKVIDRIQAAFADVPGEEIEREIAKALAEVREEMRAERELAAGVGS